MSESDYVTLLQQQGRGEQAAALLPLGSNDCILVKYEPNRDGSTERGNQFVLEANRQIVLSVKDTTLLNPIGFANSMATLIVPDEVYHESALSDLPITNVVSVNGKEIAGNDVLFQELYTLLDKSPYLVSSSARKASIIHENSSTFLLLGFLVVLLFIVSGSILFFNNISATAESKNEYTILSYMGYSHAQLKKCCQSRCLPFTVFRL